MGVGSRRSISAVALGLGLLWLLASREPLAGAARAPKAVTLGEQPDPGPRKLPAPANRPAAELEGRTTPEYGIPDGVDRGGPATSDVEISFRPMGDGRYEILKVDPQGPYVKCYREHQIVNEIPSADCSAAEKSGANGDEAPQNTRHIR